VPVVEVKMQLNDSGEAELAGSGLDIQLVNDLKEIIE
jgi:hypothetical protein